MDFVDNILCLLYLLMWVATFVWYHYRRRVLDAGSAIIGSYILYAAFALVSINDYMFNWMYEPLRLGPYLYLYVMLMIALAPTIRFHEADIREIEDPNTRILKPLAILIILCSLMILPMVVGNFGDGIVKLIMDSDAGKDAYQEQLENADSSGSAISNIPAIIFNMLSDIAIFLTYYAVSLKKKNYWIIAGLLFAMLINMALPIMSGQRGTVILTLFTFILGFMLFKQFMPKGIVRVVRGFGVGFVLLVMVPVIAITSSRYSGTNAGITGYMSWYIGQGSVYFNNSGLDAGGIRNGDRTINLFKRIISPGDTPKNYTERRAKYRNMKLDDYYFSTFVGDFCLDFGPVIPVFIFVLFNSWVLIEIRPRGDGKIKLHQLLLVYFTMCICMQGGMTLFMYSDTGNLKIVAFGGLYAYLRYHETLLRLFPKASTPVAVTQSPQDS